MLHRALGPFGGTTYLGYTSSKESDSSHKPSSRENKTNWPTDWPMIVLDSGLSESLQHLRRDAKWWLANSERRSYLSSQ
jgi:hypothetical protein